APPPARRRAHGSRRRRLGSRTGRASVLPARRSVRWSPGPGLAATPPLARPSGIGPCGIGLSGDRSLSGTGLAGPLAVGYAPRPPVTRPVQPQPGLVVGHRYRLESLLGKGGMAVV